MTGEEVATALRSMPEIKSVEVPPAKPGKNIKLKVKYAGGGISLFGTDFALLPDFEGGSLTKVALVAEDQCLDQGRKLVERTLDVLKEKYPNRLFGEPLFDETAASGAMLKAISTGNSQRLVTGLSNGSVAVTLAQSFSYTERPDYVYGGGNWSRLANEVMKGAYESQRDSCGGTGLKRVSVAIMYLPQADADAMAAAEQKAFDEAREQAQKAL